MNLRLRCGLLRLFSSFPGRAPGVGLLLLRVSVAAALLRDVPEGHLVAMGQVSLAMALVVGILTPVLSFLCCVFECARLTAGAHLDSRFAVFILNAAGLSLLGPGAYSLDARLFGRRVIVFPRDEGPL